MAKKVVMTPGEVRRTLLRLAHEIMERNKSTERLIMVGIHTRGIPLADRLARARPAGEAAPDWIGIATRWPGIPRAPPTV